jgi:hypothetical protein
MKIMYLGIAVWPSWEIAERKMWIWRKSIDRFGYRFFYYGVGTTHWPGYRRQKIEVPLAHLLKNGWGDCTHILYTDCCDCLMMAPQGEIEAKYEAMGRPPILLSGSAQLGNVSDPNRYPIFEKTDKAFRYPNVGGFLMEAHKVVEFLEMLHERYPLYGDDCFAWYDSIAEGIIEPAIDTECDIWMVRGEGYIEVVEENGLKRILNKETGKLPAIWHNSGGSADPVSYRDKEMRPMAERLGIIAEGENL